VFVAVCVALALAVAPVAATPLDGIEDPPDLAGQFLEPGIVLRYPGVVLLHPGEDLADLLSVFLDLVLMVGKANPVNQSPPSVARSLRGNILRRVHEIL
jgi:hypothetical protein